MYMHIYIYIPGPSNRSPPATLSLQKPPKETCWKVLVHNYTYIIIYTYYPAKKKEIGPRAVDFERCSG